MLEQSVSDKRPNPFRQAAANMARDRDIGRWSVQNHRDTKRDAVVIRPPPALLLRGARLAATVTHRPCAGRECLPSVPPLLTTESLLGPWVLATLAHHGTCPSGLIIQSRKEDYAQARLPFPN